MWPSTKPLLLQIMAYGKPLSGPMSICPLGKINNFPCSFQENEFQFPSFSLNELILSPSALGLLVTCSGGHIYIPGPSLAHTKMMNYIK